METVIWIVQGLLALVFLMAGAMKMMQPKEKLAETMGWVEDFEPGMLKLIGGAEVVGALGLILPAVTGLSDNIVSAAAFGLAVTMILAAYTHIRRGNETMMVMVNVALLAMAIIVIWARNGDYPL